MKGFWWLPDRPEQQWFGDLRWKPGSSPRLKLQHRTVEQGSAPRIGEIACILGADKGGVPISLFDVGYSGGKEAAFLSSTRYIAGHALRGIHITSKQDLRVGRFCVSLQFLSDWVREEGFRDTEGKQTEFRAIYSRPEDWSFDLGGGITLSLCHAATSTVRARRRKVGYRLFFAMEKGAGFNWKQSRRFIAGLTHLLHFAVLKPIRTTSLSFESPTVEGEHQDSSKQIEVFNAGICRPTRKSVHEDQFVFMLEDVADRFGALCASWFEFCVQQKEALECYFPTIYFRLPDSLRLISITQALEAYHQRFRRPKNDVKFRDRIIELCNTQPRRVEQVVGDIEKFAVTVTDSRDYYTHHHPSIRKRGTVASGVKLTMMPYHLQFIFRLCVLNQFGLERDRFNVLLRQIPRVIIQY